MQLQFDRHGRAILFGVKSFSVVAGLTALLLCPSLAIEERPTASIGADEAIGTQYHIRVDDLPAPYATQSVGNRPVIIDRPAGAQLRVPEGFEVSLFADGLQHPRGMVVAPGGVVFLTEANVGQVTRLVDLDDDGLVDTKTVFARDFRLPSGIAIHEGDLYVADERAVWWLGTVEGREVAEGKRPITRAGALGDAGGHWTRMLKFSPDGKSFFVSVGSESNVNEEPKPRATIQQFDLENGAQTMYASGLRNPIGLAFYPGSDRLFTVVNERDGLGDGLVPDFLTEVTQGGFYGWPYAYLGPKADPKFGDIRPDLVAATLEPDVLLAAHSAALDLVFYDGDQFPDAYHGDAFVAFHGSWNASEPTGYKVVRVHFENGEPVGSYETFVAGFWTEGDTPARVWGRPAGVALTQEGHLLIADDEGGTIWQVRWAGD
ncbi:PQQ-dependent sugar dehydrogenase [Parvibaculaceae bacterium PLY_AMNH_Bact1]|nr:PQQ-dependent sugar dehydrogenase [Parvibaculaceae bacterium PLY_AMNH_Bact1]